MEYHQFWTYPQSHFFQIKILRSLVGVGLRNPGGLKKIPPGVFIPTLSQATHSHALNTLKPAFHIVTSAFFETV